MEADKGNEGTPYQPIELEDELTQTKLDSSHGSTSSPSSSTLTEDSSNSDSVVMEVFRRRGERQWRIKRARPLFVPPPERISESQTLETSVEELEEDEFNIEVSFADYLQYGEVLAQRNQLVLPRPAQSNRSVSSSMMTETEASVLAELEVTPVRGSNDRAVRAVAGAHQVEVEERVQDGGISSAQISSASPSSRGLQTGGNTANSSPMSQVSATTGARTSNGTENVSTVTPNRSVEAPQLGESQSSVSSTDSESTGTTQPEGPVDITSAGRNSVPAVNIIVECSETDESPQASLSNVRITGAQDNLNFIIEDAGDQVSDSLEQSSLVALLDVGERAFPPGSAPVDTAIAMETFSEKPQRVLSRAHKIHGVDIQSGSITQHLILPNRVNNLPPSNTLPNVVVSDVERKMTETKLRPRQPDTISFLARPKKMFWPSTTRGSSVGKQTSGIHGSSAALTNFPHKSSTINSQSNSCGHRPSKSQNTELGAPQACNSSTTLEAKSKDHVRAVKLPPGITAKNISGSRKEASFISTVVPHPRSALRSVNLKDSLNPARGSTQSVLTGNLISAGNTRTSSTSSANSPEESRNSAVQISGRPSRHQKSGKALDSIATIHEEETELIPGRPLLVQPGSSLDTVWETPAGSLVRFPDVNATRREGVPCSSRSSNHVTSTSHRNNSEQPKVSSASYEEVDRTQAAQPSPRIKNNTEKVGRGSVSKSTSKITGQRGKTKSPPSKEFSLRVKHSVTLTCGRTSRLRKLPVFNYQSKIRLSVARGALYSTPEKTATKNKSGCEGKAGDENGEASETNWDTSSDLSDVDTMEPPAPLRNLNSAYPVSLTPWKKGNLGQRTDSWSKNLKVAYPVSLTLWKKGGLVQRKHPELKKSGQVGAVAVGDFEPVQTTSRAAAATAASNVKKTKNSTKTRVDKDLEYYKQNTNLIKTELVKSIAESHGIRVSKTELENITELLNKELEKMLDELQSKSLRDDGIFFFRELEDAFRSRGLLYGLGNNELLAYFADFLNPQDFNKCLGVLIPEGNEHDTHNN